MCKLEDYFELENYTILIDDAIPSAREREREKEWERERDEILYKRVCASGREGDNVNGEIWVAGLYAR